MRAGDGLIRHLFVPGLLGPMPGLERKHVPALPHLQNLLVRSDRLTEPVGYANSLFTLFGIDAPSAGDLPTAAVGFLADTGEAPAGFLLHADPLHLIPDRDHVLAFDLDQDPLNDTEIAELVAVFNSHYGDDGLRLSGSSSGRIYLHCDRPAGSIQTHSLSAVIGRNLDPFLPHGEERRWWHGLINETQMLCHSLQLNAEREARGRPTLGGLWFSGGGRLPPRAAGAVTRMSGDCHLARGLLALHAGDGADEMFIEHALDKAVQRADPDAWLRTIAAIEDRLVGLSADSEELHVHPCNGSAYRWNNRLARRWWRRKRPLFDYLDVARPRMGHEER